MKLLRILGLPIAVVAVALFSNTTQADKYSGTTEIFKESPAVKPFFDSAYGYAVFPVVGKGGFVVGGAYGTGQVYRQGSATGTVKLIKASIGLQAGGQAFSQIIFFQDKRAYDEFISGDFEFEAGLSAVLITAGAQAKAGTEGLTAGASAGPATGAQAPTNYYKGMAVFVHAKGGLMYEASVGGQKFIFEPDE